MGVSQQLILQSGERFYGETSEPLEHITYGEVVFNTGMVGYVESLTDPSYAGQILVFTYPLIGNYGVPSDKSWESEKIHARGVIVSELSPFYAHHEARHSLSAWLKAQNIPILTGVDTRALTKCLRSKGVVPGAIAPLQAKDCQFENFELKNWVEEVTVSAPITYGKGEKTIIVVDCGMKENILRQLLSFPLRVKRVPYDYDFTKEEYDGVFISNGPGDPTLCDKTVQHVRQAMKTNKPIFGICLGIQIMALAAGGKTYKLTFGHRSHNQPCLHLPTNRSYLTSQNHGYAVEEGSLPSDWDITFRNLNDQSIAGIAHRTKPFFSVQFHPEACPGPLDTEWLFQQFFETLKRS